MFCQLKGKVKVRKAGDEILFLQNEKNKIIFEIL